MLKEKLAVLRFMTQGQVEDDILKKSFNHRVENGKFIFTFKAEIDPSDWTACYGSAS